MEISQRHQRAIANTLYWYKVCVRALEEKVSKNNLHDLIHGFVDTYTCILCTTTEVHDGNCQYCIWGQQDGKEWGSPFYNQSECIHVCKSSYTTISKVKRDSKIVCYYPEEDDNIEVDYKELKKVLNIRYKAMVNKLKAAGYELID